MPRKLEQICLKCLKPPGQRSTFMHMKPNSEPLNSFMAPVHIILKEPPSNQLLEAMKNSKQFWSNKTYYFLHKFYSYLNFYLLSFFFVCFFYIHYLKSGLLHTHITERKRTNKYFLRSKHFYFSVFSNKFKLHVKSKR